MNAAPDRALDPSSVRNGGWVRDGAALAGAMLVAGAIAAVVRQDANWDLKNYHFYNAWAFVHGRMGTDLAPAQLQTYLNPLLDVPFYAMVAADWPPRAIAFVMGLWAGAGAYFLLKVLAILFGALPPRERRNYIAFAAVIGLLAADPVALLASTMNEWQGAALTMLALFLIVRRLGLPAIGVATLLAAGCVSGAAAGLKLTAATYSVGLCAALFARAPIARRGLPDAFAFGIGVLAGVAITQGFWFYTLEARFGNPFFPFYNDWFRSPWWDARPVLEQQFGPKSALEWLYFPLLLFGRTAGVVAASGFRDWRLPFLYLAGAGALLAWLIRRRRDTTPATPGPADAWRFVAVFWVCAYGVWLAVHGVYRYLIPLELLCGALLLFCLRWIFAGRALNPAIVAVTVLLIASTRYPYLERIGYGRHYIEVGAPLIEPKAALLLVDDAPMAFVLPYLPSDARFIGVNNNLVAPTMTHRLATEIARVVRTHDGPLYVLAATPGSNASALAAHGLRRVEGGCVPVTSNLTKHAFELCRLERTRSASGR